MGVGSYQPLATGKGVRRESESEGSPRQSPELRNPDPSIVNQQVQKTVGRIKMSHYLRIHDVENSVNH